MSVARAFLFADLRDYTAFIEGAGDSAAADLIRDFRALVRERLAAHEGAEVKTEGDSFYLVFPSASGAIAFAVDLMRGAAAPADDRALRLGVGIHAGETVPLEGQFVGSAVNLAARIGAAAAAGEILVSDTVRGLVRTAIPYALVDRGHVPLKGIAEPIRLFAVEWREGEPIVLAREAVSAPSALASRDLVGRAAELERLLALSGALADGRGGVVAIGGAAGLGKTRLVSEWAARAGGAAVLVGSCGETDARPLYEPFVAVLRHLARSSAEEARLRRVSPELVALLPELQSGDRPRQLDRDALFGSFLRLLRDHARTRPLVLVSEDMHWADESTLALFRFLAGEAEATPYVLVATYRDDELHRGHALRPLLVELFRRAGTTKLELRPLDEGSSRELLAHLEVESPIDDTQRRRIAELAEGNPLFIEELARSARGDGGLPLSIAEAVLRRVAALDDEARRLVTYAAVSGQRTGFDLLVRLLGTAERDVLRAARASIEQSLLVEAEDGIAFRHALTREAVYGDLMRRERRLLHGEVAEALVALRGDDPSAAAEIERQLTEAGQPERALPYALVAGEHALRLLAPSEAVAHYERAVDASAAGSIERARGLEGLGNAYRLGLEVGKAASSLRDAVALYERVGGSADVARAQIALASALPYGREEWRAWRDAWARSETHGTPAQLFFIANRLAERAYQFMDDAEALRWTATARDLAAKTGNEGPLTASRRTALEIEHPRGWRTEDEGILARHLDRAIERDVAVLTAYRRYIDSRCREADREERDRLLERARAYAESHAPGVPRAMIFRFGQPWMSWLEGRWDRVEGLWRELQLRFAGDDVAEIYPDTGPLAAAIRVESDGPAAGAALRSAAQRQAKSETWRGTLGAAAHLANLQLADGRVSEVVATLDEMLRRRGPKALDVSMALLVARVVTAAAILARDARVLEPWLAAEDDLRGEGRLFVGLADHVRAARLAIDGDAAADARYAEASDVYRRLGWDHLAAEVAWQRARAGNDVDLGTAIAFYEERGARWRATWLREGGWR